MLFDIAAIPIPAAIFVATIPRELKKPIKYGPKTSEKLNSEIKAGFSIASIINRMTPQTPQKKRNPNPILNVSYEYFIIFLKMRSYVAKQNEAMSPPITILIVLKLNSS
jgi:hypothetical protein